MYFFNISFDKICFASYLWDSLIQAKEAISLDYYQTDCNLGNMYFIIVCDPILCIAIVIWLRDFLIELICACNSKEFDPERSYSIIISYSRVLD